MTDVVNQNYVSNPSFRDGVDGWTALDSTITASATGGKFGTECLQVEKTIEQYSGVQSSRYSSVNRRGTSFNYTASAYVKIPSGEANGTILVSILWYTLGKVYISSSDSTATAITNGSDWARITVANATPPSNARYASVRIVQTTAGSAGELFLVDAVKLEEGATATDFQEFIDQGQENAIVNRGLTNVPRPHITGMQLNADIELNDLVFNTIDQDGFVWVITDITGVFETPESEFPEVSRGFYADGDFETRGRYKARYITLQGSILVPEGSYVSEARDKLTRAADLVAGGAWLRLKPKNEPVRALFVRANGKLETDVVNPRGRIDFSIGLKAADPVIYEWNEERSDGYFVANVVASNYSGAQEGSVEIGNSGNYPVGAVYEIRGPIQGDNATLFNYSNAELITITGRVRGERYKNITQKKLEEGVATLKFSRTHDFFVGDEILVSLNSNRSVTGVTRGSGNSYATLTYASGFGFSDGDNVILSNVDASLDGELLPISNVTFTSFTVPSTVTTALSNAALTTATVYNQTNDLFNGAQFVSGTPNNRSVTYSIDRRETVPLANVADSSATYMRNVVYMDADHLEIDTKNNEVALNGDVNGQRGKLDALIDWIKLTAGSNIIELDDSGQLPLYTEKKSITADGAATLFTTLPHGLEVGENIHVEWVEGNYDTNGRARVSSYSRSGTTANITATSHGFSDGNSVVLSNISRGVDGQYVVANAATNTFTVTTETSATEYPTVVDGLAKKILPVTFYAKANNTVTLTVPSHGMTAGAPIYITGVHPDLDGQAWLTAVSTSPSTVTYDTRYRVPAGKIVTTAAPAGAQIARRYPITDTTEYSITYETGTSNNTPETNVAMGMVASTEGGNYHAVRSVYRSKNVATLTTFTKHGFAAGDYLTVEGAEQSGFHVAFANPKSVLSYVTSGTYVTLNVTSHGLAVDDTLTVYGIDTGVDNVDINGTYVVTSSANANSVTYKLDSSVKLSYTTVSKELASNLAIITLDEAPQFGAIDDDGNPTRISVADLGAPYDGTFDVVSVDTRDNTVTYSVTNIDIALAADTDGTVGISLNKSPERAFIFKKNQILYYAINASGATDGSGFANTIAGQYAHMWTQTAHGLSAGDTVEISGLSSVVNGNQTVLAAPSSTRFMVKIDNTALVQRKAATAARTATKTVLTIKATSHGLYPGDYIYFDGQSGTPTPDGKYKVTSRPGPDSFTISTTNTAAYTATTTHYWYPIREAAYVVEAYPVLSSPAPTDYTFSYRNPNATPNVATTNVVTRSGEVVVNSDASMRVFYRSGWIG